MRVSLARFILFHQRRVLCRNLGGRWQEVIVGDVWSFSPLHVPYLANYYAPVSCEHAAVASILGHRRTLKAQLEVKCMYFRDQQLMRQAGAYISPQSSVPLEMLVSKRI